MYLVFEQINSCKYDTLLKFSVSAHSKTNPLSTGWLNDLNVKKLVLVMQDLESKENVERWSFDVVCDKTVKSDPE